MKERFIIVIAAVILLLNMTVVSEAGVCARKSTDNPVLNLGTNGNWDDAHIHSPSVLPTLTGFQMWYSGNDGGNTRIGYATWNGVSDEWNKFSDVGGYVLNIGTAGSWDDVYVTSPTVLYANGIYHMWYAGYDGGNWRIGYANGDLWMDFTPQTKTTIIPPTGGVVNYSVQVGNYTPSNVSGDFWVNLIHPDNTKTLMHKIGGTANSCDLLNFSYGDPIPPGYTEGVYTLEANIGTYPNNVSKKDTQSFIKGACQ